jgi:hypothetical protein
MQEAGRFNFIHVGASWVGIARAIGGMEAVDPSVRERVLQHPALGALEQQTCELQWDCPCCYLSCQ